MLENRIKDYFRKRDEVVAVFLFGSYAAGRQRPDSDVDIAILFQTKEPGAIRDSIDTFMVDLGRLLEKDIHPVGLNHAGEDLLRQVLDKGQCVVVNDPHAYASFRVAAMAKIFDFARYRGLMQSALIKSLAQG